MGLAIIAVLVAVWQMGANRKQATAYRQEINAADQASQDTTAPLAKLKSFVSSHMGTSTTFELTASYNRALAAASASSNGAVYSQAQAACASHADSIAQAKCVSAYVATHSSPGGEVAAMPDRAKYQYSFHAPLATPDLTGSMLLVGAAALSLAILSYGLRKS